MQAAGDDDLVQERLQRHRDAGLQRDGADRQAEAGQPRCSAMYRTARMLGLLALDAYGLDLVGGDRAALVVEVVQYVCQHIGNLRIA